jgi:hypothetical protein
LRQNSIASFGNLPLCSRGEALLLAGRDDPPSTTMAAAESWLESKWEG